MKIAIWGAGEFGKYIYRYLKTGSENLVSCFFDNNVDLHGKYIEEIKILSTKDIKRIVQEKQIDIVLIAFKYTNSLYWELMNDEFWHYIVGIIRYTVFTKQIPFNLENLCANDYIIWLKDNRPLIDILQYQLIDSCNLNCKGCSHFSNIYEDSTPVSLDVFERDFRQINSVIYCNKIQLLGGEPLLCPNISDYIFILRKIFPYVEIDLFTNGLLLLSVNKEFFDVCKNANIYIIISFYPPLSQYVDRITNLLNSYNIKFRFTQKKNHFLKNIDLNANNNVKTAHDRCRMRMCHMLKNGILYKCPLTALGKRFLDKYDVKMQLSKGIDIFNKNINWLYEIRKIEFEPIDTCMYCGREEEFEWERSKLPIIEDWTI